ncbi:MAG: helix-turn-helix domain-containing protein [Devosia sp.]
MKPIIDGLTPDDGLADERFLSRLGDQVLRRRKSLGLTRRALSELCGISTRFIAHLEYGEANISILRLRRIADALNTSVCELMGEKPKASPRADLAAHPGAIADLFRHANADDQQMVIDLLLRSTRRRSRAA